MDESSGTQVIAGAHARTLAAATARIELLTDRTGDIPAMPRRRRGGLMRPVTSVTKSVGKHLFKLATRGFDFRHQSAEGVIDLQHRRYMLDYGSYARLYADGREWDGRSGRLLSTLPPDERRLPTPLWLLDVLVGATAAIDEGTDDVRGTTCRRFTATVDLSRASKVTPSGVAVPSLVGRFEDLLALPVEVSVDDEYVRRVCFRREYGTETLELWDFGLALDDLDWTHLPTFRSGEAAAGQ